MATPRYHYLPFLGAALLLQFVFVRAETTTGSQQDRRPMAACDNSNATRPLERPWFRVARNLGRYPTVPKLDDRSGGAGFPGIRDVYQGDLNWIDKFLEARTSSAAEAQLAQGGVRGLQTACEAGDEFTTYSLLYPTAAGCYSEISDGSDIYLTSGNDRIVLPVPLSSSSSSTSPDFVWAAAVVLDMNATAPLVDADCFSAQLYTPLSHPTATVSWVCLVGGDAMVVSENDFRVECGCSSGTSTPATAITPSPVGGMGCVASSIDVSSSVVGLFGGCYVDAELEGITVFSQTGVVSDGSRGVFPVAVDQDQVDLRWIVGTYADTTSGGEVSPLCISQEGALTTHPADSTWLCDMTGTQDFVLVSDVEFNVECGCVSTNPPSTIAPTLSALPPSPPPSPAVPLATLMPTPSVGKLTQSPVPNILTPSPVVPTPSPGVPSLGCDASSIDISSSQFTDYEGCYVDAEIDGAEVYSQTGVVGDGSRGVFGVYVDEEQTDERWAVGTLESTSSGSVINAVCISVEGFSVTHPADATWLCDLSGTDDASLASETQFNVECGCGSTISSTVSDILPTLAPETEPVVVPSPTSDSTAEPSDAELLGSSDGSESASRNILVFWMFCATMAATIANMFPAV